MHQAWTEWQAAIVAALVVTVCLFSARRAPALGWAAAGLGVLGGWLALAAPPLTLAGARALIPSLGIPLIERLPSVVLLAVAGAAFAERAFWGAGLLGAACGWLLDGAPLVLPHDLASAVALALAVIGLGALAARAGSLAAPTAALAALTLAAALSAVHAPRAWVLAALCPAAAAVVVWVAPRARPTMLPLTIAMGAAALGAVLADGSAVRLSPRPVQAAALAPLLAVWLASRVRPRIGPAAAPVGFVAAVAIAWIAARGR